MNIKSEDRNPEYEVWSYYELGTKEPSVFLFANRYGSGSFGLVEGVESLLPKRQLIYQIMYYADLSMFGDYFMDRYLELGFLWDRELFVQLKSNFISNKFKDKQNPTYKYKEDKI